MRLSVETAKKVKTSANANILGNIDAVLGLAQSVKDGKIKLYLSGLKFNFVKVLDNKVVVKTKFSSIIVKGTETINNDGSHQIILLKEGKVWKIMDLKSSN